MSSKIYISDELLAAYLEGNVDKKELEQVIVAAKSDPELQEVLNIALQVEEEEPTMLQMAAESRRNLCDVECEEFVLKRRGVQYDEAELLNVAKENHWIRKGGTPLQYMGCLLEYMGLPIDRKYGASIEDLRETLVRGIGVIVAVDSDKLYPERPDEEDAANHAVVVIGIDSKMIKIYDPGIISEVEIQLPLFQSAWNESNNYMVSIKSI